MGSTRCQSSRLALQCRGTAKVRSVEFGGAAFVHLGAAAAGGLASGCKGSDDGEMTCAKPAKCARPHKQSCIHDVALLKKHVQTFFDHKADELARGLVCYYELFAIPSALPLNCV